MSNNKPDNRVPSAPEMMLDRLVKAIDAEVGLSDYWLEQVEELRSALRSSPPEKRDEVGWLIEYRSVGNAPTYWTGKKDFTYNHIEAVRFARREDAERVMHSSGQMVFVVKNLYAVEHMWCPRILEALAEDG